MVIDLKRELKKYFGFDTFRPGQEKILQNLLAHQDTLAILPTGGGKTLLYQMYGAITHQRVMIVSPLISLMQDQVSRLQFLGSKRVVALTSALDFQEKMAILNHLNRYQFIYVSPEMLANDQVQQRLRRLSIGLFVVDEAHCISEWGPDFRPDYLKLGTVREMLGRPLTLMMTATATQPVRRDIIRHMNFRFEDVHQIVLGGWTVSRGFTFNSSFWQGIWTLSVPPVPLEWALTRITSALSFITTCRRTFKATFKKLVAAGEINNRGWQF